MKKIPITLTGRYPVRIKLLGLLLFPAILCADYCCKPGLLSVGVGTFDTLRPHSRKLQFQAEYQWSASWHGIQPFFGVMGTEQGALYFCFGGGYDFYIGRHVILTPSFAPGIYIKNGGKELGFPLEFRSSLAFAIEFNNFSRLGVQFYHISNGSLGFKNPGEESLVIFYSVALF